MKYALGAILLIIACLCLIVNVKKLIKAIKVYKAKKKGKKTDEPKSSCAGSTENVENTSEKE